MEESVASVDSVTSLVSVLGSPVGAGGVQHNDTMCRHSWSLGADSLEIAKAHLAWTEHGVGIL